MQDAQAQADTRARLRAIRLLAMRLNATTAAVKLPQMRELIDAEMEARVASPSRDRVERSGRTRAAS